MRPTPDALSRIVLAVAPLLMVSREGAGAGPPPTPFVAADRAGRLAYEVEPRGDRIPDFSHCGYGGAAWPSRTSRRAS